jgi:hypothetical protein
MRSLSLSLRLVATAAVALTFSLPSVAQASAGHAHASADAASALVTRIDGPVTRGIEIARAADRTCTSRPLGGRAGTSQIGYRAPADGTVTARLRAGSGDWDLAIFDSAGTLVASSSAFRANEVAQVTLRRGARILIQACRISGASSRARLETRLARIDLSRVAVQRGPTSLVRVAVRHRWQLDLLERIGFDVTHAMGPGWANVVLYGDSDRERLRGIGIPFSTVIADMAVAERRARAADRAYKARVGRSPLPSGRTEYRQLEDYQSEMKEIADRFPALVRPFTLKEKTFQGRDLQVLEIAQDVHDGDDGRPVLFVNGIHHAREWPATESVMELAWDLVLSHGKDPRITKIMRDVRILIMPFTNTDGFVVSRAATDPEPDAELAGAYQLASGVVIFGGSLSYKRKNCNPVIVPIASFPCELAIGVDNNRNYGEGWGGPGASTNPNDQGYRGSAPFSEPETRAVQSLSSQTNTTVLLSMHNVAAKVLRPPGLEEDGFAPDEEGLKALGKKIADATGYTNEYGWQLYDTTGTTKDWVYAATGAFGYTVELGPANGFFHGDYEVHVVEQYLGEPRKGGLREGYLSAAEWTRDASHSSRIAGRAPAGRTLRLTKSFKTETSPVCALVDPLPVGVGDEFYCVGPGAVQTVDEKIDVTMKVPSSGEFEWWVNPSTRPFVQKKGGRETYKLTCEQDGQVLQTAEVFVARGQAAQLDLPCGGRLVSRLKVTLGRLVAWTGGRARAQIRVSGGALRSVRVALVDRRGRTVASGAMASVRGNRRIALRPRRGARVRAGRYRLRVTAVRPDRSRYRGSRMVTVRR